MPTRSRCQWAALSKCSPELGCSKFLSNGHYFLHFCAGAAFNWRHWVNRQGSPLLLASKAIYWQSWSRLLFVVDY
jgi:hypothetical protein